MDDFDAVTHVVPTGGAKVYCCYGAYYDVECTPDCPSCRRAADATAWAAYSRAWPQAMSGEGQPHPRFDHNWLTGEPAASADEIERWERSILQMPTVDFTGAGL